MSANCPHGSLARAFGLNNPNMNQDDLCDIEQCDSVNNVKSNHIFEKTIGVKNWSLNVHSESTKKIFYKNDV